MIAGWAADLRSGRVIAFAALAAAAVTGFYPFFLAGDAESYQLFHLCFWCFAGFYVVYFSVPFMRTAEESDFPELWASLGRIIKQFVNCAGVVFASALTEVSGARWIFWCNAALVAAMAAWLAFGAAHRRWRNLRAGNRNTKPSPPRRLRKTNAWRPSPKNTASPRARRKY